MFDFGDSFIQWVFTGADAKVKWSQGPFLGGKSDLVSLFLKIDHRRSAVLGKTGQDSKVSTFKDNEQRSKENEE